jgi:hypothetical protein
MAVTALEQALSRLAREGELYERLPPDRVRCYACDHRCLILSGQRGVCKVHWNEGGRLMVPAGYVAALQLDPVEKKPFFHAFPGSRALSFGMPGCDLHCCGIGSWSAAGVRVWQIASWGQGPRGGQPLPEGPSVDHPLAASMLRAIYFMLQRGVPYCDLGGNFFDRRDKARIARRLLDRLRDLGVDVQGTTLA